MSNSVVARPLSRKNIRDFAKKIRKDTGLDKCLFFPIIEFIELSLPIFDPCFELEIWSKENMGNCHGKTVPEEHRIILREDVYDNTINGRGRDRFTVAHELAHYLLHLSCNIGLARADGEIKPYEDPEWQANAFAAELLMPANLIADMSANLIQTKCGVSFSAASYQKSILSKGRLYR